MRDIGYQVVFYKVHYDSHCIDVIFPELVTSRSGALTKLILWGHLLASDLDFYDDEPLNLDDDAS
jgi:hypothetical protein